jgi:hypothetical protein
MVTGRTNEPALNAFVKAYCNLKKNKDIDVRGTQDKLMRSAQFYNKCTTDAKHITCTLAK